MATLAEAGPTYTTGTSLTARPQTLGAAVTRDRGLVSLEGLPKEGWLRDVKAQIAELLFLDEGWDSSVAAAISGSDVEKAIEWVDIISEAVTEIRRPYVSPTVNGGVNIEWHVADAHFDLTVEDGEVDVYASATGVDWEGPIREIPVEAVAVLFRFFVQR